MKNKLQKKSPIWFFAPLFLFGLTQMASADVVTDVTAMLTNAETILGLVIGISLTWITFKLIARIGRAVKG